MKAIVEVVMAFRHTQPHTPAGPLARTRAYATRMVRYYVSQHEKWHAREKDVLFELSELSLLVVLLVTLGVIEL